MKTTRVFMMRADEVECKINLRKWSFIVGKNLRKFWSPCALCSNWCAVALSFTDAGSNTIYRTAFLLEKNIVWVFEKHAWPDWKYLDSATDIKWDLSVNQSHSYLTMILHELLKSWLMRRYLWDSNLRDSEFWRQWVCISKYSVPFICTCLRWVDISLTLSYERQ